MFNETMGFKFNEFNVQGLNEYVGSNHKISQMVVFSDVTLLVSKAR